MPPRKRRALNSKKTVYLTETRTLISYSQDPPPDPPPIPGAYVVVLHDRSIATTNALARVTDSYLVPIIERLRELAQNECVSVARIVFTKPSPPESKDSASFRSEFSPALNALSSMRAGAAGEPTVALSLVDGIFVALQMLDRQLELRTASGRDPILHIFVVTSNTSQVTANLQDFEWRNVVVEIRKRKAGLGLVLLTPPNPHLLAFFEQISADETIKPWFPVKGDEVYLAGLSPSGKHTQPNAPQPQGRKRRRTEDDDEDYMPTKPKKSQKKSVTTKAASPTRVSPTSMPSPPTSTSRRPARSTGVSRREGLPSSLSVSPPIPPVRSSTSQLSHGAPPTAQQPQRSSTHVAIGTGAQTSGSWTAVNALKHDLDRYLGQSNALGPDGLPSLYNNTGPASVSNVPANSTEHFNDSSMATQTSTSYPHSSMAATTFNTDNHDPYMTAPSNPTLLGQADSGNSAPLDFNAITGTTETSPSGHLAPESFSDRFPMPFIPSPEQIDEFLRTGIVLQGSSAGSVPQDSPAALSAHEHSQSQSSPANTASTSTSQYLSYSSRTPLLNPHLLPQHLASGPLPVAIPQTTQLTPGPSASGTSYPSMPRSQQPMWGGAAPISQMAPIPRDEPPAPSQTSPRGQGRQVGEYNATQMYSPRLAGAQQQRPPASNSAAARRSSPLSYSHHPTPASTVSLRLVDSPSPPERPDSDSEQKPPSSNQPYFSSGHLVGGNPSKVALTFTIGVDGLFYDGDTPKRLRVPVSVISSPDHNVRSDLWPISTFSITPSSLSSRVIWVDFFAFLSRYRIPTCSLRANTRIAGGIRAFEVEYLASFDKTVRLMIERESFARIPFRVPGGPPQAGIVLFPSVEQHGAGVSLHAAFFEHMNIPRPEDITPIPTSVPSNIAPPSLSSNTHIPKPEPNESSTALDYIPARAPRASSSSSSHPHPHYHPYNPHPSPRNITSRPLYSSPLASTSPLLPVGPQIPTMPDPGFQAQTRIEHRMLSSSSSTGPVRSVSAATPRAAPYPSNRQGSGPQRTASSSYSVYNPAPQQQSFLSQATPQATYHPQVVPIPNAPVPPTMGSWMPTSPEQTRAGQYSSGNMAGSTRQQSYSPGLSQAARWYSHDTARPSTPSSATIHRPTYAAPTGSSQMHRPLSGTRSPSLSYVPPTFPGDVASGSAAPPQSQGVRTPPSYSRSPYIQPLQDFPLQPQPQEGFAQQPYQYQYPYPYPNS